MVYTTAAKSCHKISKGKAFWKNVCLPLNLYGTERFTNSRKQCHHTNIVDLKYAQRDILDLKYTQRDILRGNIGDPST